MDTYWTINFQITKRIKFSGINYFINISDLCKSCYFVFQDKNCFMLLNFDDGVDLQDGSLFENIVSAEADIIADILSWEYEVGLSEKEITCGNIRNVAAPTFKPYDANYNYEGLLTGTVTKDKLEILSGFRQIQNEMSRPLKYLMYYRMLEMIASSYKGSVDKIIKDRKIKTKFIFDKRTTGKTKTLITHFRNKIHPTKKSYRFPLSELNDYLPEIERVVIGLVHNIITV